jgi:hypothetical protein
VFHNLEGFLRQLLAVQLLSENKVLTISLFLICLLRRSPEDEWQLIALRLNLYMMLMWEVVLLYYCGCSMNSQSDYCVYNTTHNTDTHLNHFNLLTK